MTERRSVATRARLYLAGATLLALVAAFAVFFAAWSQYTVSARTSELSRQVAALAAGQAVNGAGPDAVLGGFRERLLGVQAGLIGAELFVTDGRGVVLRSTAASAPASLPLDRLRAAGSLAGATGATTTTTRSGVLRTAAGVSVLVVAAPIDAAGDTGLATSEAATGPAATSAAPEQLVAVQGLREIRQAQLGMLAIGALALVAAALVAWVAGGLLAKRLTAPLVRLKSAAEEVAAGGWGTQVAEEGDVETASLARSFNRMSTRVADTYSAQNAFVADVSHEIRTPLTSIRGFAEAMLDGTVTEEAQQQRALAVIRDEALRIDDVSQTLLALSQLDAGAVSIAHEPVDVVLLGDALHGRFSATAEQAGVRLDIELAGAGAVGGARAGSGRDPLAPLGDADRLLQAASALVANALAYTPTGGRVLVSQHSDGDRWVLAVDDTGPGIPAEKRATIFDRFARLDASRASGQGGAGLGLAICQRLVELMGGTVSASDSALGGARFEIELEARRLQD